MRPRSISSWLTTPAVPFGTAAAWASVRDGSTPPFLLCGQAPSQRSSRRSGRPSPMHESTTVIAGLRKPWMTRFRESDYRAVRRLGDEFLATILRRIPE